MFLVGQNRPEKHENAWEFQGIFSSKAAAIAACRNENYWLVPVELDVEWPDELVSMPVAEFPLA